jgi:biopolymer transport protein ExbD
MAGGNIIASDGDYNAEINIIPLVDIMLVLLIIFIITVPVITKAVKVTLPTNYHEPTETKPENINLSVDAFGQVYWNDNQIKMEDLWQYARVEAVKDPQPEVHIRADKRVRYQYVGDVLTMLQRNGLLKVGFIAEPPLGGG